MIKISHKEQPKSLYLIRHGQTHFNLEDVALGCVDLGLDQVGRRQAELLAENFRDRGITRLISGPLKRSKQTAEYIGASCGVDIEICEELCDPANLPILENYCQPTTERAMTVSTVDYERHENIFSHHVKTVIQDIVDKAAPAESLAVVTHQTVNRLLIASLFPGRFTNPMTIPQAPGCWNLIGITPGDRYKLLVINAMPMSEREAVVAREHLPN